MHSVKFNTMKNNMQYGFNLLCFLNIGTVGNKIGKSDRGQVGVCLANRGVFFYYADILS